MFGKVASCKTTTTLYHFYIPQFGKYSCFSLSLREGIVCMTWKTLVFLNDSGWKQTVVACAKYWSDPGKGWPAAGCSKWKLYVVETVLWSGCITSCLVCELKIRDLPSSGKAKTVPLCSSFLCFVLNSFLCTCSLTSCQITNALLIPTFLYQRRKTCMSEEWVSLTRTVQGVSPTDMSTVLSCGVSLFLCNACSGRVQAQHRGAARQVTTKTRSQRHSLETLARLQIVSGFSSV